MKTIQSNIKYIVSSILLLVFSLSYSQDHLAGTWEGSFMDNFRTVVELIRDNSSDLSGTIKMYSGADQIQNDNLTQIQLDQHTLTFYIPAKETWFKGILSEDFNTLSGQFIFPDQSEHSVQLQRKGEKNRSESMRYHNFRDRSDSVYTFSLLKSDLDYLRQTLETSHPALYRVTDRETWDHYFMQAYEHISRGSDLDSFYGVVASLVEKAGCSHTGVRLPAEYVSLVHTYGNFFPFSVFVSEDGLFINASYGDNGKDDLEGRKILAINGISPGVITDHLLEMIPSEGNRMSAKYYELNQHFHDYFYIHDHSPAFAIEVPDGPGIKTLTVKACLYRDLIGDHTADPVKIPVNYSVDQVNRAGILAITSFAILDMNRYFFLLDSIFVSLKRDSLPVLVLDLRDNAGGHPIFAAQLLSYLTDREFTYFKRNDLVPDFEPLYHPMKPNPAHFRGKIFVLVNGGCLSTTGHLVSLLEYYTDAVFIGEEPGSTFRCNDLSKKITLPGTGLEVNIPGTTFEAAVDTSVIKDPFLPDYLIKQTISDWIGNKDAYLDYVRTLLL